jgi:hypothetical protein
MAGKRDKPRVKRRDFLAGSVAAVGALGSARSTPAGASGDGGDSAGALPTPRDAAPRRPYNGPYAGETLRRAVHRHNLRHDLSDHASPERSTFACGAEGGLLLCSWPRGGRLTLPFVYSNKVWTGIGTVGVRSNEPFLEVRSGTIDVRRIEYHPYVAPAAARPI